LHAKETVTTKVQVSLAEIALVFLKLGMTAFGGPVAHIAMMKDEFVRKRQWITQTEFLDRLAAASLIPGPSSTEVAIFIGQSKRGWAGLVVGGCCFIIPSAVLVTLIAALYARFGALPKFAGILYGIKPAVIAIILHALWSLSRTAIKTKSLAVIGVTAVGIAGVLSPGVDRSSERGNQGSGRYQTHALVDFQHVGSFVKQGLLLGIALDLLWSESQVLKGRFCFTARRGIR